MFDSLIGPEGLMRLRAMAESSPVGALMEVGVYRGGSAVLLYAIAQEQGRRLYLYDTFFGHAAPHAADDAANHPAGRFADAADPQALAALLPYATILPGVFPASLINMAPVAFVHADADLYEPTKAICELMPARMVPGGRIWFDDYGAQECPGCTRAVDEAFGHAPHSLGRLVTIHA